ncbi:MAG: sigma-54-dependent Fis family transcriptional regulator [Acidobacteria bacterium]|nr:sigma-54-dependent Fis family transcriptional regulator [Acidobacteriota bacterium]
MTQPGRRAVLVVEDDAELRQTVCESLQASGFAAAESPDAKDAIERLKGFAYDALVTDLNLPDGSGMDVLEEALSRYPQIRAVVVTGFGGVADAVSAIKRGAVDFLIKPFQLTQLARVLEASIDQLRLREENAELRAQLRERFRFDSIIGRHSTMRQLFATLEQVAPTNSTVLLIGETGTGKELIARTIHHNSPRADKKFVAFNAAAIPETLAEAELFGHAKGAFTGAVSARVGRFELADGGTLFIDEVASMSLPLQAKLLRALQEREVQRLGESKSMKVDIRVITATNSDLRHLVREGSFREDLFYRLNVIPIRLPPLRSRREDIPLLAQHFVNKSCAENGIPPKPITQEVLQMLMAHPWPGNIRQIENAMEHAVAMSMAAPAIGPEALPEEVRSQTNSALVPVVSIPDEGLDFTAVVSQLERELLTRSLEKTGGNKRQAARLLSLSRTTFLDKLQRLSIEEAAVAPLQVESGN